MNLKGLNVTIKERIQSNKKVIIGGMVSVVLLLGLYVLFLHNRVSTTPFRVSQSDMGEERAISQEEFQDMVNDIIEEKEGGL